VIYTTNDKNNAKLIPGNPRSRAEETVKALTDIVYPNKEHKILINIRSVKAAVFLAQ